jgi:hypothetical protein
VLDSRYTPILVYKDTTGGDEPYEVLVKMTSAILNLIGTNEISAYISFLRFCETNSFMFNPTSNKKEKRKTNESKFTKLVHIVVCVQV